MELTKKEWAVLKEMASNLLKGTTDSGMGYYNVGDTFIEEEVQLLKKIANGQ